LPEQTTAYTAVKQDETNLAIAEAWAWLVAQEGEKEARSALFAGAIGSYKSPHSRTDIQLDDPQEAVEIIMMANHLLRIIDARSTL
jgi:hypothetical protein